MPRLPDEIMADFEAARLGLSDIDIYDVLWEIIDDVSQSFELAIEGAGINAHTTLTVLGTVSTYLVNNYGDD